MKRLLILTLTLLVCIAIPLVGANPIGYSESEYASAILTLYILIIILLFAIASLAIITVKRKKITKPTFLFLLVLSCWLLFLVIALYDSTYHVALAIGDRITPEGYITFTLNYLTIATSIAAIVYSVYLTGKRLAKHLLARHPSLFG